MSVDLKKFLNVYKFSTELPGTAKKVNFKPISTFQMKELISSVDTDSENAVDNLINSCVTDEGFDVKDMSLQDRFFLLVELRKKSKGSTYEVMFDCIKCKSQVISIVDLNNLKVKKLNSKFDYKIKLDDNITVEVSLISRSLQLEAKNIVKEMIRSGEIQEDDKEMNEVIFSYILSIKKIITPDGTIENLSLEDKMVLFKEGPQSFYDEIIKWFEKLDFGIDFTTTTKCIHCKHEEKESITLQNFFF